MAMNYYNEFYNARKLTDILLTIFTAHKENKIIEAREFRKVYLQREDFSFVNGTLR